MCGIAGIIRTAGLTEKDRVSASRLETLLQHRGPDGTGVFTDRHCALVQTRLALIGPIICPLPLSSPDGRYTIVYNGEVYNFESLRRELRMETPFSIGTDTEVVLAAWIRWGSQALNRLNGMFAFFIWDRVERRGFAATDPLGIKPLLYHASGEHFVFASEAGALIESGAAPFAPEEEAIAEALVAPYFSSTATLPFAGVKRLMPGHWIEITPERVTVTPYFKFEHARAQVADVDAFVEKVAEQVEQAVVAALRANGPVGVFLSGGVDSSLLAAIAQRHSGRPVRAWTIAYEGQETVDYSRSLILRSSDRPFAERVANRHGCKHSIVHVNRKLYEAALPRTLHSNDLICAWEQEVSQHVLAEAASTDVKAVLVGDAADETHFGYSFLLNPDRIASPRRVIEFFGCAPLRRSLLDDPVSYFTGKYRKFSEIRGYSWKNPYEQRLAMSCLIFHFWLTRLLHTSTMGCVYFATTDQRPGG